VYAWPNGASLALVVCNNIEHFAFRAGLGSDSAQIGAQQNQRNYAWRDYGNRAGLWYLLDLLDEFDLPCAHNVNAAVLDACPEIAPALLARGDESDEFVVRPSSRTIGNQLEQLISTEAAGAQSP